MKNIALIGFMASGKTTIGKMLAREMHFEFTDTDFLVEKDENKKISDIFKTHGEAYFREAEHRILKHVAEQPRQVISTGGGILTIPKNIAVLKENSFVVFLDVPFEVLSSRVTDTSTRPLFADKEKAFMLWQDRYETYKNTADFIIDTSKEPLNRSITKIKEAFLKYTR